MEKKNGQSDEPWANAKLVVVFNSIESRTLLVASEIFQDSTPGSVQVAGGSSPCLSYLLPFSYVIETFSLDPVGRGRYSCIPNIPLVGEIVDVHDCQLWALAVKGGSSSCRTRIYRRVPLDYYRDRRHPPRILIVFGSFYTRLRYSCLLASTMLVVEVLK